MHYAGLLFCILISCGIGTSVESAENIEQVVQRGLVIQTLSNAHDSISCGSCARPCLDEEVRCLHEIDPADVCTDGLECIDRAISCVKGRCGERCLYGILICDTFAQTKAPENLTPRNCIGPKANPCLCALDLCLADCQRSGFDHTCVEQCDSEYENCTGGL